LQEYLVPPLKIIAFPEMGSSESDGSQTPDGSTPPAESPFSTGPSDNVPSPDNVPPEGGPPFRAEPPRPEDRIWKFWPTVGLGAAIFAVYFIIQSAVAIIFTLVYMLNRISEDTQLDLTEIAGSLSTNGLLISIATILSGIAGVALIVVFVRIRRGITLRDYLALYPIKPVTFGILFLVILLLLGISIGLEQLGSTTENSSFMENIYTSSVWLPLLWIAVVVFAPFFEEWFFRGFVFAGLSRSFLQPAGAILVTSLVFALLHALQYNLIGVATVFVLGLAFGIVRYKTGSLWSTMILHAAWNLIGMVGAALTFG